MDNYLFKIDGVGFSRIGVEALKRSFRIPYGPNAGEMLSGDYERDIVGTYYDYDLTITAELLPESEYDALFDVLSAPVNSHIVEMPYGKKSIVYEAMIESGGDELIPMDEGTWWGDLNVQIRAKAPQRLADTYQGPQIVISGGGVPTGAIIIWSGTAEDIPDEWALCDGEDGRPDLRDKFVLGAGTSHVVGDTGGFVDQNDNNVSSHPNMPPYYDLCYIIKTS